LELTRETDRVVSAWAIAPMVIRGRLVEMAALVGSLFEASKAPVALRKAKALIAEVVERGSRAAPVLGEGTRPDGTRVYLYASAEVDSEMAAARLAQYVDRNGIELAGADTKPRKLAHPKAASAAV
jgi:hypothetical protein